MRPTVLSSRRIRLWLSVAVLCSFSTAVWGAEDAGGSTEAAAVVVGEPLGIVLEPNSVTLIGARAGQQLIVTGQYAEAEVRDLTTATEFTSSDPKIVQIEGSVVRPHGNGSATVTAKVGPHSATVEVAVKNFETTIPVTFKAEVLAALNKAGCNSGACHGSPSGKAGFRLSLRGFDPPLDILTLRSEFFGRRTNVMSPAESLILKKPLMEVAHGGGRRIRKGDPVYSVLHNWIGEGLKLDPAGTPDLLRIEVLPKQRVFHDEAARQQLVVLGHFSDGTVHDLTPLTVFSSSNESVATVTESGTVQKAGRGETAVLVRYLDKMDTSYITFLEDVPGFAWNNPQPHNFVDQRVFEKLEQLQILPSELCTDEEFLRRAYLDTTGRLPTIAETEAFLADQSPDRRNQLIDRLVDSDDFATFWTLKWADILRSNSKNLKLAGVHKFHRWIYDNIRNDTPLDRFARELMTASGSVYENPAASYWRSSRDESDATETTAQLFLGIAAAFKRVGRKNGPVAEEEIIFVQNTGEVTQPRTGQTMKVHLLLKGDVDIPNDQDRRRVFAEWMTAAENPFFAKASVNRIWGHLMGRGIVDPIDDFRDSNPPSNAALLDELAQKFVESNFSRKWAVRTIMQSRAYQLSSRKNDFNKDDEIYFSHANTRLLSAEQLLDAICAVTGVAESFAGLPPGTRAVELPDPPTDHYFLKIFGQPQREMACQCERSNESNLSQALQMINGPVVHNKLRDENGRIAQMIKAGRSDDEIIATLYLAALSRPPEAEELSASNAHIARATTEAKQTRQQALEDVGWAVLNAKEFLFQH